MEDVFRFADEIGPSQIVHIHRPSLGMKAVLVVDNVAAGPSIGGVRMAADVSTEECFRLARAMTLKNAAALLPHGGGKSVIFGDPGMPDRQKEEWIRAFACAIRDVADYIPGPDMGTDERCMAWTKDEIGRAVGLPAEIGGIPLDEIGATGFGLSVCAEVAQDFSNVTLKGARVAVQGFGSVGQHAARFLMRHGARLVAAADSRGMLSSPDGIDVDALIAHKSTGASVIDFGEGEKAEGDALIDVECDIWIPAARPDVIHAGNVERLRTRMVLAGANIPVSPEAEEALHKRGVLCIPDFIANAGGVICGSVEYHGGTETQAFQTIDEKLRANTRTVLEAAARSDVPPRAAAVELAEQRVRAASSSRRFG